MSKKIILHIGTHKTATTSSQRLLENNIDKLREHDVCYISLEKMRKDITKLFHDTSKLSQEKLYNIIHNVAESKLILSDENILYATDAIIGGKLYPLSQSHLYTFCETMKDSQIEIFLTLRLPHLFLPAMYSEHIRHHSFVTFADFIKKFDVEGFSYRKIFEWLFDLPPNTTVHIIPFETEFGGGPLCTTQAILKEAGLTDNDIAVNNEVFEHLRSSYSAEEIAHITKITSEENPKATKDFIKSLPIHNVIHKGTKFSPFSDETIAILTERYTRDLEYLFTFSVNRWCF